MLEGSVRGWHGWSSWKLHWNQEEVGHQGPVRCHFRPWQQQFQLNNVYGNHDCIDGSTSDFVVWDHICLWTTRSTSFKTNERLDIGRQLAQLSWVREVKVWLSDSRMNDGILWVSGRILDRSDMLMSMASTGAKAWQRVWLVEQHWVQFTPFDDRVSKVVFQNFRV